MNEGMPDPGEMKAPRAGARIYVMGGQVYPVTESVEVTSRTLEEADEEMVEFHVILHTRESWEVVRWFTHPRAVMGYLELTDPLQEKLEEDHRREEQEMREAQAQTGGLRVLGFPGGFSGFGGGQ